ncbi:Flavonoid 4'-O-methyltransferase [Capsicum chinense]|nr:Flavonoid 4'-O-methyltransferase [Capsicum chinense]
MDENEMSIESIDRNNEVQVIEQILEAKIAKPSKIKRVRQKKKRILDVETTLLRYNASLNEIENLSFVGEDMLQYIPHADAILLKLVKHNWSDEDYVKILERYREASTYSDERRKEKVLIIDMVLNRDKYEADMTEVKILFDVLMTAIP